MKKLTLIIASLALIVSSTYAQSNDSRDQVFFGIKAGFNYANLYNTDGEEFNADAKFGLAAGTFLAIPIVEYIGFQPEVLFSQKGFKAERRVLGQTHSHTRTSSFIDIPLFLSLKPNRNFTFVAGPQFSYLVHQKDEFTNGILSFEEEKNIENTNYRKNTMGAAAGFDFNFNQLVLGTRAGIDVQRNNGDGTSTNPNYKNAWIQATIGYRFFND